MTADPATKHRRRRGAQLEAEILDATWEVLGDLGWSNLTIDEVATRSGTGKAAIYRRWADKTQLVWAAYQHAATRSEFIERQTFGSLRADLLHLLTDLGAFLNGPFGEATKALAGAPGPVEKWDDEADASPIVANLLDAAVSRGEISAATSNRRALRLGVDLGNFQFLMTGRTLTQEEAVDIVDRLWLPALGMT